MQQFCIRAHRLFPAKKHFNFNPFHSQHHLHLLDEIPRRNQPSATPRPLETLRQQLLLDAPLDPAMAIEALKCCHGDVLQGIKLHGYVLSSGLDSYAAVSNSLMNMYSKSGRFDLACKIFEIMQSPDVVSWNTILSGFAHSDEALDFAARMHRTSNVFDNVTFTTALAFSSDLRDIGFVLQLHSLLLKLGFESDTIVGNALITAYMRGSSLSDATKVFDEMVDRDLVSWNALISGYTQEGECRFEAIRVFLRMIRELKGLDHVCFSSAIAACRHNKSLVLGQQIHGSVIKVGFENHYLVSNVLMSLYSKCGMTECAKRVFHRIFRCDVVSWTTMITIDEEKAMAHFKEMLMDGVYPNEVTFVALIYAVSTKSSEVESRMVHGFCHKTGFVREPSISNSLITMYAKLESMEESRKVFEEMNYRELLSWNTLISGYAQNNMCEEALKVFSSAILHSRPDQFTFGSVISAISRVETVSLDYGQRCHCHIVKVGLENDAHVSGALIDMYARRGSIEDSQKLFDDTPEKGLVTWTSMISAHAMHGNYRLVMSLFDGMVRVGIRPDPIALLAVLTACGRRGMVDRGLKFFDSMVKDHGVEPWREHYASIVDMLGRTGRLAEAESFIKKMPMQPGVSTFQSLLGACRVHRNAEMGERMADALLELEPTEAGAYVLMANIHAERGEWEKVAMIRKGMRDRGVKKEIGFSWVDIRGKGDSMHMYGFSSDDTSHPQTKEIYRMVDCLGLDMRSLEDA